MIIDIVLGAPDGRGGLENVLLLVEKELIKRGNQVRVFTFSPSLYPEWDEQFQEIYYFDTEGSIFPGDGDLFRQALHYREYIEILGVADIVLATHTPYFSALCRLALSYLGEECPPIISWLHGPPEAYGGGSYLVHADAHLAISKEVSNRMQQYVESKLIHYVANPVFTSSPTLKRKDGVLKFVYVGRLIIFDKRLDILFNSLSKIQGNWELQIVGDGPDKAFLIELASNLDITNNITFSGWHNRPWEVINEASALVLSSDSEGFGLVLVEALSRGLPVISSNSEGPSEIIIEGENGWLYPIGDQIKLTDILQDIIDGNRKLPSPIVCKQSVEQYQLSTVVNRIEKILLNYSNM